MVDFFLESGRPLYVNTDNLLRSHLVGANRGIHPGISAADDDDPFTDFHCFTAVNGFEKVQPFDNPFMTRPRDHFGHMAAAGNHHRIIFTAYCGKFRFINRIVCDEADTHLFNPRQFHFKRLMGKPRAWDHLFHLAAHRFMRFIHRNFMSVTSHLPGCR